MSAVVAKNYIFLSIGPPRMGTVTVRTVGVFFINPNPIDFQSAVGKLNFLTGESHHPLDYPVTCIDRIFDSDNVEPFRKIFASTRFVLDYP